MTEDQFNAMVNADEDALERIIGPIQKALDVAYLFCEYQPWSFVSIESIGSGGMEIDTRRNESCHCHPEWEHRTFVLPLRYLVMDEGDLRAELQQAQADREAEEQRKKQAQAAADKQSQEASERAQLAKLQAKYGDQ